MGILKNLLKKNQKAAESEVKAEPKAKKDADVKEEKTEVKGAKAESKAKKAPEAKRVIGYSHPNFSGSIKRALPTHENPKAK